MIDFSQQKILSSYKTSFFIYKGNLISLKKALNDYYDLIDTLLDRDVKRWRIQRNVIRHFHNVISSAKSFIEYLNVFKREIGFQNELEQKMETIFEKSELYKFMNLLRNYIMHINNLPLISRKEMKRQNGTIKTDQYESFDKIPIIEYLNTLIKRGKSKNKQKYILAKSYLDNAAKYVSC